MRAGRGTNGRTITRGIPPKSVLAKGHMPFLILCDGHEEDDNEEEDEGVVGDKVKKQEKHQHIRRKRFVEISVDRNSFPNHILPSFASEKTNMRGGEGQELGEKFSPGEARGAGGGAGRAGGGAGGGAGGEAMSSRNMAEKENFGSLEGENEILPYPRFALRTSSQFT